MVSSRLQLVTLTLLLLRSVAADIDCVSGLKANSLGLHDRQGFTYLPHATSGLQCAQYCQQFPETVDYWWDTNECDCFDVPAYQVIEFNGWYYGTCTGGTSAINTAPLLSSIALTTPSPSATGDSTTAIDSTTATPTPSTPSSTLETSTSSTYALLPSSTTEVSSTTTSSSTSLTTKTSTSAPVISSTSSTSKVTTSNSSTISSTISSSISSSTSSTISSTISTSILTNATSTLISSTSTFNGTSVTLTPAAIAKAQTNMAGQITLSMTMLLLPLALLF